MLDRVAPLFADPSGADTMGMAAPTYWTAELVRQLPDDGNRYEVVYGELLVTPAPRFDHQLLVSRLTLALGKFLEQQPVGLVLSSPADISWGTDVLVQPDVFVVPRAEALRHDWAQIRTLLLVIEVLSPSTTRADRFTKRHRYQEAHVPLYWVVDGETQRVEVWTSGAESPLVETKRLVWHPHGAAWKFVLELEELFRAV